MRHSARADHVVRFQLLDRWPFDLSVYQLTGKIVHTRPAVALAPGELGWKDTVRVDPLTVTRNQTHQTN